MAASDSSTDPHADHRDAKRRKRMTVSGRSIKSVLVPLIAKRVASVHHKEAKSHTNSDRT